MIKALPAPENGIIWHPSKWRYDFWSGGRLVGWISMEAIYEFRRARMDWRVYMLRDVFRFPPKAIKYWIERSGQELN